MRYKIVSQSDDGVYCVVTNDDGSTFGQIVRGEDSKTIEGIEAVIEAVIKDAITKNTTRERSPEVLAAIATGAERQIIRGQR